MSTPVEPAPGEDRARRSRVSIVLLLLLFLVPPAIAWWLFFGEDGWRPSGSTNHGTLIVPPRPLGDLPGLTRLDGSVLPEDYLRGKWTLLYIGSSRCGEACRSNLYKMRQVRLAQGENVNRVQRLYLLTDTERQDELRAALEEYPRMDVAIPDASSRSEILRHFNIGESSLHQAQRIYVTDPLGNLMMLYESDAEPGGMLKDLKRLLKVSRIG